MVPKNVHHFYSKFKWKRLELYQVSQQPALGGCLKDPHGSHLSTHLHNQIKKIDIISRFLFSVSVFLCSYNVMVVHRNSISFHNLNALHLFL